MATTKRAYLANHYQKFFAWVADQGIMSMTDIKNFTAKHSVSVERITKVVETFFLPYQQAGKLKEYVEQNLAQGTTFLAKFAHLYKDDEQTSKELARLAKLKLSEAQVITLVSYIQYAINVILL